MRSRWLYMVLRLGLLGTSYAGGAGAHALLDEPAPRDDRDGYKDGSPCGVGFDASQPLTSYAAGQTVKVQWLETVDHPGCFLVEFSAGADQDFQVLGRKSHSNPPPPEGPTSGEPRHWSLDVTLPPTPCSGCTLRVRQLMLEADVAANACTDVGAARGAIYTTCANLTLASGGSAATPAAAGADDSSCSVRPPSGHSLAFATALFAAMLLRRRRERGAPSRLMSSAQNFSGTTGVGAPSAEGVGLVPGQAVHGTSGALVLSRNFSGRSVLGRPFYVP